MLPLFSTGVSLINLSCFVYVCIYISSGMCGASNGTLEVHWVIKIYVMWCIDVVVLSRGKFTGLV